MMEAVKKSAFAAPFGNERSEMWRHYFYLDGIFAKVKYNYAVTAHKAQGSTYTNCMLAMWDIVKNPRLEERNRIIYVGATRARNMLYIVQ
jgi:ATP-dependent exoDNAse (exonuclease V) alpha subunit